MFKELMARAKKVVEKVIAPKKTVTIEEVVADVCPNCEDSGRVCSVCKHGYNTEDVVA